MKKNLDITNPRFNKRIWPVPATSLNRGSTIKSRFHCTVSHRFGCNRFAQDLLDFYIQQPILTYAKKFLSHYETVILRDLGADSEGGGVGRKFNLEKKKCRKKSSTLLLSYLTFLADIFFSPV